MSQIKKNGESTRQTSQQVPEERVPCTLRTGTTPAVWLKHRVQNKDWKVVTPRQSWEDTRALFTTWEYWFYPRSMARHWKVLQRRVLYYKNHYFLIINYCFFFCNLLLMFCIIYIFNYDEELSRRVKASWLLFHP